MKIKNLHIENIGLIANETIEFNQPLMLFYGAIRAGKSTILNCVRWVFGGAFPSDIIRHGQGEAVIQIMFENGYLKREFYYSEDKKEVKSRPLVLVLDGAKVPRPVDKLKAMLNPFLLDQDHLVRMTELERKKYFAELFHTATPELDAEFNKCNTEAQELRIKVKGYGDIDLTPVERVNVEVLRAARISRIAQATSAITLAQAHNNRIESENTKVAGIKESTQEWIEEVVSIQVKIDLLQKELNNAKAEVDAGKAWLLNHPNQALVTVPDAANVDDLNERIEGAVQANVKADQYDRNRVRHAQKLADEAKVLDLERRQRAIRDERIRKLDAISDTCGIPGLEFKEDGGFIFEDTTPSMLSTSQLMKLSNLLSSLYPEGIGISLIDRAESLGESIFDYIERAKKQNKTILASVVGEKPAKVPEHVGVFVVTDGKLTQ